MKREYRFIRGIIVSDLFKEKAWYLFEDNWHTKKALILGVLIVA